METQLDLMTFTKGITYLLALAFLFGFVAFWQWQSHRGKGLAIRVIPMAVVSFGFLFLVSTCVGNPASTTSAASKAADSQWWPNVDSAHYQANILGPAKFAAHEMGSDIVSCQTCHHHSDEPKACSECHNEPFDSDTPTKPGLKAAYHQKCEQCHTAALNGPMTCINCHSESPEKAQVAKEKSPYPATPPAISHPLLDRYANCFACHVDEGPLPLPGNHSEYRANVVCLGCHKPSSGNATLSMEVSLPELKSADAGEAQAPAAISSGPAAAEPAPAAKQSSGPSKITHSVEGRENCVICHPAGGGGAKAAPADHAGKTDDSCQMCHKV